MKTYELTVRQSRFAGFKVEASSYEEAKRKALEMAQKSNPVWVVGGYRVDEGDLG